MCRKTILLLLIWTLSGFLAMASSQDDFRIARISYLEGHVSFQHVNDADWSAASINLALQPGDRLYTGENGRVEIEFDDGSVLRLAEKTDIEILSLKENLIQLRMMLGLVSLTVRSHIGVEVNTPAAAFNILRKGIYRFDVAENGDTDGIVRKGLLEAASNSFSRRVESGELIHVTPGDQGSQLLSRYERRDDWDEWTDRRDADMVAYESRRYLPDYAYVGVRELDHYGRWVVIDPYGPAWIPSYIGAGWSPYWEGRWCYRPFWGWTWVSYEPWGWLPYHYGRWHHHSHHGWCWIPGASFGFHFWSPGLVRFYHGPGWVSWCPLGPGDYYNVNNYHFNNTYVYLLNNMRLNQRRAPDDLANRNVRGAFRTASTEQFVSRSLGGSTDRLSAIAGVEQPWKHGRMVADRLDVQPTRSSYAPAPERAAARPAVESKLPAVIRTEPSIVARRQGLYNRITNPAAPPAATSRGSGRSVPGEGEGMERGSAAAGRSATAGSPARDATRNPPADSGSGSSIWNRQPSVGSDRNPRSMPGRTIQTPPAGRRNETPRSYGRNVPGDLNRQESPFRGQERPSTSSSPGIDRNPRSRMGEMPDRPAPRPENAPSRRTESPPTPRNESSAPSPRTEPERPRPKSRPRVPDPPESYVRSWRSAPRTYQSDTRSSYGIQRSVPQGRWQGSVASPQSPPSFSRQGSWPSGERFSAPSLPSRNFMGGGGLSGPAPGMMRSAPRSAPSGGASGILRRRSN